MGLFGLFGGGKPSFKPAAHQTVEIEFEDLDGEFQSYFVEILEVSKRSLTLASPGNDMNPVNISPGIPVNVSYFDEGKDTFFSYRGLVKDSRDREFEIEAPAKNSVEHEEVPKRDDLFRVDVNIPVRFQARRTVHAQMASTHAVTPHSLYLLTNLGIPPETDIRVVLEIPNANAIEVDARAIGSEKAPDGRKHISQVQLEEISALDRDAILSYAVYFQKRQERADARGVTQ
jgi:hypothetical protein